MPKTSFINGDASQGTRGTRVTAEYLNAVNNHHHTGLDQDGDGALAYAADTGTANAYVVNLSPALTAYVIGMPIYFKAGNTNIGSSTINVNNLGVKNIKKNLVEDLVTGDIISGDIVVVVFDGANFQLIQVPQRDKLVAADIIQDFVVTGLLGTDPGASLTMTIPAGIAYVLGRRVVKLTGASDLTRTYTASKDTYVDISHTGAITYTEVNNGAAAPSVVANSLRLQKVVTNVTEITGVTDLRTTPGMKISASSAANAVPVSGTDSKIARGFIPDNVPGIMSGELSAKNGSTVTLPFGALTDIVTLDLNTVTTGDLIYCYAHARVTAGNSAGQNSFSLRKASGTATISFGHDYTELFHYENAAASEQLGWSLSGVARVTDGGTLVIKSAWFTNGTGGSINTGNGQIYAVFLKKQ